MARTAGAAASIVSKFFAPKGLLGVAMAIALEVAGCAVGPMAIPADQKADILAALTSGSVQLSCGVPCAGEFGYNRRFMAALVTNKDWVPLAILVQQIGFQQDLPYFYLGLAAEGLGAPSAAFVYYRLSIELSQSGRGCHFINCNGVSLPDDAEMHLAAVSNALQSQKRVAR